MNKNEKKIKELRKTLKFGVLPTLISILTAALTAMGTTSCMGHGPF